MQKESEDTAGSEAKQSQISDKSPEKKFQQMEWFKKHRVAVVRKMLDRNNIGLSSDRGIDLLIAECSEKLKEVRNSEITKKRLKPLLAPIGIIFVSLSTAYLFDVNLISEEIESTTFSIAWFSEIMQSLATDIVSSETTLLLFIILCVYVILFYLVYAFIVLPFFVHIIDRDWYLIEELKEILLYIKKENAECTDESTADITPAAK